MCTQWWSRVKISKLWLVIGKLTREKYAGMHADTDNKENNFWQKLSYGVLERHRRFASHLYNLYVWNNIEFSFSVSSFSQYFIISIFLWTYNGTIPSSPYHAVRFVERLTDTIFRQNLEFIDSTSRAGWYPRSRLHN